VIGVQRRLTRACSTTACGAVNRWHFGNYFPAPLTAAADAQSVGQLVEIQ